MAIRIEITPLGLTHSYLVRPVDDRAARLFRALQPEIAALEAAARRLGLLAPLHPNADAGDGDNRVH